MVATRFFVSGRVQGVWFRAGTRAEAQRLGVAGYAHNLADGRVEVVAVGAADDIAQLAAWLEQGPPDARVASIETELLDAALYDELVGFNCG